MKKYVAMFFLSILWSAYAVAQRPMEYTLHSAETGNVNGTAPVVMGLTATTLQVVIADAWDGTLTFTVSIDKSNYTNVLCRNLANGNVSATATANGTYLCPIVGANLFRAPITGRTVGSVTVTAQHTGPGADANVISLTTGTGASDLGKAEDAAHTSGDTGVAAFGVRNDTHTTAFSGTNGDYTPLGVDSSGKLGVRGTFAEDAASTDADLGLQILAVRQATPANSSGTDGDYEPLKIDTGYLWVRDRSILLDDAPFTAATSAVQPMAGVFDDTAPDSVDEGDAGAVRMSANRNLYATIRDAAGNERGANVNASNAVLVAQTGELPAGTQNIGDVDVVSVVPGTGATNLGKAEDAVHSTGDVGIMALTVRQDTAAALGGTDGDYQPIVTDGSGRVHVNVGVFPDNEPFNVAQINGVTPLMGNGVTGTGSQRVTIASDNTAFSVNIGTFPDNEPFNVAQFGGSAVVTGTGVGGAGIPRVTISSDSSLAANQSTNVAQINGVTPLMGSGATGTGSPRISIATDANVVDTELPAAAALADGASNPTSPTIGADVLLYNGSTWDRQRSGSATSTQPHYGAGLVHRAGGAFTFLASTSHTATTVLSAQTGLGGFNTLVVTWDVTAAERDSADETYDLYVTCGDGVSVWDVAHFPQIITTGAKRYTTFIHGNLLNQNVTTAVPGVAANDPGTFKTDTTGADQGKRTLAAGTIRHGALGDRCGADIVIAGTIVTGITHNLTFTAKP